MTRRPVLLWWGIGALLAAMALGASMTAPGPDLPSAIDRGWNQLMIDIQSPAMVQFGQIMNVVGGGWIATYLVPLVVLAALVLTRRWRAAVFVAVSLLASVAVVQLLKLLFGRSRPEEMLVLSDYGSFPSGHTANAATIAVIAVLLIPRVWVLLLGVLWALTMAFSRTLLSVHWLTDTIGGMLVGAGTVLIVGAIMLPWVRARSGAAPSTSGSEDTPTS
ncbi:phosphatase PAP2 family protein [Microbacterium murale]|uniref:Membrane-associated phospholipid phosphatase n=1 Tax=Microbacterium murale TaxID=1081040 RepID=A0ABU0P540_9MICO|nr:phosphatase PAP2 family protein [Microbacterium murale]MDQ0642450.1 membrane-associated phospholipid phosphatase [Microbacterium murale]